LYVAFVLLPFAMPLQLLLVGGCGNLYMRNS